MGESVISEFVSIEDISDRNSPDFIAKFLMEKNNV